MVPNTSMTAWETSVSTKASLGVIVGMSLCLSVGEGKSGQSGAKGPCIRVANRARRVIAPLGSPNIEHRHGMAQR
jgi:hypothetical protein